MPNLHLSEQELHALLQALPDVLLVIDREGRYLHIVTKATQLLYQAPELLQDHTFAEVFPPGQAAYFLQAVHTSLDEQRVVQIEYSLDVMSGERLFDAMISPLDAGRVVWLARDVTESKRAARALKEAETKYRRLFEEAIEGIFQTTRDGTYITANPMLARIYGYNSPAELMSGITDIGGQLYVEPARRAEFQRLMHEQGAVSRFISQIRRRDGSVIWISENARACLDENGVLTGYEGTVVDITERVETEQKLRVSENKLRQIIEHSSNLFYVHTPEHVFTYLSPQTRHFLDCEPEEALVRWMEFATDNPVNSEGFLCTQRAIDTGEAQPTFQLELKGKKGRVIWVEVNEAPVVENGKTVAVVGAFVDITQRRAVENELKYQAFHDALTGLPNRVLFMDRLEHALARGQRHGGINAVLFLDLDRFKIVNDSLGHETGDALLQAVAGRLLECLRPGDTVARLGGDEFTILMEDIHGVNDAVHVAERIADELHASFPLRGQEIVVTTSIGIALAEPGGNGEETPTAESLLRDADVAMYRAKTRGKARHEVFNPTMNERALERLALETDLWQALGREELRVHYQPKIDLRTGEIVGLEALVRWQHPVRGHVPPIDFIGVAEEIGLISAMGEWVLFEACRQARVWQAVCANSRDLEISVNLSSRQLQHADLPQTIRRVLQETALEPRLLKLEITESVVMEDAEGARLLLRELKDLGVQLSIDDFGTGYSSLSQLKRFPVDNLKIDRSFVQNLGSDPEDTAIVKAIITLASALGLSVTAEGVETGEQAELLQTMNCDWAQGYFYSQPLAAEAISALLAKCCA